MEINILFNSKAIIDELITGWGISFLIDNHILFDTGENGDFLIHNMEILGVNPKDIDTVILSHDHWDHTGGLWKILEINPGITVHTCPGFKEDFYNQINQYKVHVVKHEKMECIAANIFSTGEFSCQYKGRFLAEQTLMIMTNNGINVITGCAHAGIIKILEHVKDYFPGKHLVAVIGGFHMLNADQREIEWIVNRTQELGVKRVGPTHCSGIDSENMFRIYFKNEVLSTDAGDCITL